jgi:ABC-type uncharacterized transport system ATPase subunit
MTDTERADTPLVELKNMHVAFGGVHAVEDVTIDILAGEVRAPVGGNGGWQRRRQNHTRPDIVRGTSRRFG